MIPANNTIMLFDIQNDDIITNVLSSYPIYDENYRQTLNTKILDHYAYEEIGFETPFLFAHYLKVRLNEIMPKYNKLYESELLKIDPLSNYSYKETVEKEGESTSNTTSENEGESTSTGTNEEEYSSSNTNTVTENHVFQNTPQGNLRNEDISNYTYATTHNMDGENTTGTATKNSSVNSSNSTTNNSSNEYNSTLNNTENYVRNIIGNQNVSSTKLYKEYVSDFQSIDKLIIDELYDLFMQTVEIL